MSNRLSKDEFLQAAKLRFAGNPIVDEQRLDRGQRQIKIDSESIKWAGCSLSVIAKPIKGEHENDFVNLAEYTMNHWAKKTVNPIGDLKDARDMLLQLSLIDKSVLSMVEYLDAQYDFYK